MKTKPKRQPVSYRRLRAAALEWVKAKLRVQEYYLSGIDVRDEIAHLIQDRDLVEGELLRICVKMLAAKGKA